jgi:hypothetical protein
MIAKSKWIRLPLPVLLLAVCAGCAGRATTGSSSSPQRTPSHGLQTTQDVRAYQAALFGVTQSEVSWGYEPKGDVKPSGMLSSAVVFVKVEHVKAGGGAVEFDAMQLYLGPAAFREARREGKPVPNDPFWIRNQYRHLQRARLAKGCVIVGDPIYWRGAVIDRNKLAAMTTSTGPWFWMVIDDRQRVEALVHLYTP